MHIDRLAHALFSAATRRTMLGLGTTSLLAALGIGVADAKKKTKKCKKKCGLCAKCKKGKCKPKKAGTSCGTGKQCFANGQCLACDVCASGCPHETLEQAIEAASDGATIQVCPGSYPSNVSIADKQLTVIGAGAGKGGTTLDGGGDGTVLTVQGATVTLHDLRLSGGEAASGGGIRNTSGTLTLSACVVSENVAINGGGIYNQSGTVTLTDSTVSENEADANGGGIQNGGTVILFGSDISENTASNGGGIYNSSGTATLDAPSRVTGNKASNTGGGGGIYNGGTVELASAANVSGNELDNCAGVDVPLCED